jgi:type II secretory pathway component PulJ
MIRTRKSRGAERPREPRRRGFTLLEVILATSLAIVLLAALYAALKLHLTFAQRGPEQVARAQKARAIVELIATDVRSLVQPPPAPKSESASGATASSESSQGSSGGSTGGTSGGTAGGTSQGDNSNASASGDSTSSSATSAESTIPSSAYSTAYGVLGGTDWLQMYVSQERSDLDDAESSALSGSVTRVTNIVRVTYSATIVTTRPDARGRTQRLGLTRSVVAAAGAERFDTASDDSDLRATTDYLGDDIALVQFQYWDDATATWLDSWGVDTPIAPPRAIRVTISLVPPDEYAETQLGLAGGMSTWQPTYSIVIPITTWDPDAENMTGT